MSNPANIRAAAAAVLIAQLGSAWSVSSTYRAKPEPPQLDIMFLGFKYDTAMQSGNEDVELIVRACVQAGEDVAYQQALDDLIDWTGATTSVKGALEKDKTWGGTISSCRVSEVSELKLFPTEGGGLPGVEFTVCVTPNG